MKWQSTQKNPNDKLLISNQIVNEKMSNTFGHSIVRHYFFYLTLVLRKSTLLIPSLLLLSLTLTTPVFAQTPISTPKVPLTPADKFPRIANIYLGTINRSDYDKLASYDLLVIIPEIRYYNPDFFAYARAKNPNIIILPYIYSAQVNIEGLDDSASDLKRSFFEAATAERYLYTSTHQRVDVWKNIIFSMNVTTDWPDVWPQVVKQKVLDTGLWDGIFYDVVEGSTTHYANGDIDINNDGVRDDPETINRAWRHGMGRLLTNTRSVIGPSYYIVINGSSVAEYQAPINGRMFESFPTPWEGRGRWIDTMSLYAAQAAQNTTPLTTIINTTTRDKGSQYDYQLMRYGLASALLGNGYSSFDFGSSDHHQVWTYDEYNASLGRPIASAVDIINNSSNIVPSVWRRDFEQGATFVNATDKPIELQLTQDFERIHGLQDPRVNTGQITSDVALGPKDGILLMKPLEKIIGTPFINGAFARVFTTDGVVKRTGFFSYNAVAPGGSTIVTLPPSESASVRTIAAVGSQLEFYDDAGGRIKTIKPYGEKFKGSITFALGDIAGSGRRQIVTIPGTGGTLHIRSFTLEGTVGTVNANVRTERVNKHSIAIIPGGNGKPGSIVIGAGTKHKPIVSIYHANGTLSTTWGAFEGAFLSGVSVAVVNGPTLTIVVGRNAPGKGEVRLFDPSGKLQGLFFAYRPTAVSGVVPASTDVDGDGIPELLALTTK